MPVRSNNTKQFIAGAYVIRIKISCGERDSVYFFNWQNQDIFTFRQEKEVITRSTKQALEEQKNRARRALDMPPKLHDGPCMLPELGKPIYGNPNESHAREQHAREE